MRTKIRARFHKGVLEPLDKVKLREGEEVSLLILTPSEVSGMQEALAATAGGWAGLVDTDELGRDIYASRLLQTRPEPRL
jgi:predicted DNA-binding antitoxin AbrB/MazE fold protein